MKKNILLGLMIFMTAMVNFFQKPVSALNSPLGLSNEDKARLATTGENIEKLMSQSGSVYKSNAILAGINPNDPNDVACSGCSGSCSGHCSGSCTGHCSNSSGTCE